MKFCAFCGEAHNEVTTTCSEECSDELIKHEFADSLDITNACLWCPARGDQVKFKFSHCCWSCYHHRRQHGSCDRFGGPRDIFKHCSCCTPFQDRLDARSKNASPKVVLLVDKKRLKARALLVRGVAYGGRNSVPILYRDSHQFVQCAHKQDLRPELIKAAPKLDLEFIRRVERPGHRRQRTLFMLKVLEEVGTGSPKRDFLEHFPQESYDTKDRYFERMKTYLKGMGLEMKFLAEGDYGYYLFSPNKVRDMLTYIYTLDRNIGLGYHWK